MMVSQVPVIVFDFQNCRCESKFCDLPNCRQSLFELNTSPTDHHTQSHLGLSPSCNIKVVERRLTYDRTMISERMGPLPTEELERFKICSGFHINETFHGALIGETKNVCRSF
jgi:hypothetical protein